VIFDMDGMVCRVSVGGEPVAFLADPGTGVIEVVAARRGGASARARAQALVSEQLSAGRVYVEPRELRRWMQVGWVYCSREYAAAHRQQLGQALRQGRLLRARLREAAEGGAA